MFGKVAAFELRYQLRQPIFWIAVILFALLAFGVVASSSVRLGGPGNIHVNAPWQLASNTLILAVIYMFVTTAFVANVIVRDDDTGFGPLIRATRISKFDYLFGRFTGAYVAAALSFLIVPIGMWLGSLMPWVDRETVGPFQLEAYLFSYGFLGLSTLFISSAIFFTLATVTRSLMWTYVGVVAFIIARFIFALLLTRQGSEQIAALWEPNGAAAFGLATRYWTASERNTLVPAIEGYLLWNRLLWLGIAAAVLAAAYFLFDFQAGKPSRVQRRAQKLADRGASEPAAPPRLGPLPAPAFTARTAWAQLWARTRLDMGQVFKSPAYFVLLALAALLSVVNLWSSVNDDLYGGRVYPVTRLEVAALGGIFTAMTLVIAIYYAGELVWRDRERKTHEIVDATAAPDWAFLMPKALAIALVLISTFAISVPVAMLIQAIKGYFDFQLDRYFVWWVLPQSLDMLLFAVLAIFIQALSPNKFVGWAAMAVFIVATGVMASLGLEHPLYLYGAGPGVPLSDMNSQGRFWIGAYWLRLYWGAFALILLVLAYAIWPRGAELRLRHRLKRLPTRLSGAAGIAMGLGAVAFVATGGWIYLNTNVWNPYRSALEEERFLAEYEKALWRFHDVPQPTITAVKLDVDLYPRAPRVVTRGSYLIENRTGAPLAEAHVRFVDRDLEVRRFAIEGARPKTQFRRYNYTIYAFDRPMQPGERRNVTFETVREQRGFTSRPQLVSIVENGSFLNDIGITPRFGIERAGLHTDRSVRRKYKLPADRRMPKLGDTASRAHHYLRHDADFVTADITLTTDADQVPIAPGYEVSSSVANGRRTSRFVTEAPILPFFSLQSARYAVKQADHKGVRISVYSHPRHSWNVERMVRTGQASFDYFQANFSPYQFRQLRFLEFPAPQGTFAQSFAGTVPWSEGLAFIADNRDPERIDLVTYVGAHEIAHQWWAHQIIGADQQGSTVLSETLSQYSALMVMKRMYGPDMIRKFLRYELGGYLRARGGEAVEELPLGRVENQPYIHYRKGSLVMYLLQERIGEEAVNRALRRLLAQYAFKPAPYPTSADLIAALRAEAGPQHQQLITDLFERITLYDLKTRSATWKKRPDGRYDVTLRIEAKKMYADGQGRETPAPIASTELFDIGVFSAEPGKKAFSPKAVLYMRTAPLKSGEQTITVTVDQPPKFAGVDPYNKQIDRNSDDNAIRTSAS